MSAAEKCFAEQGFHQTSMRDLANRSGVSLGNLYNHFKSKTDLILEIAKLELEGLDELKSELDRIQSPVRALDEFIEFYANYYAVQDTALLVAEIASEGMRNPEIKADFLTNRKKLVSTLEAIVQDIYAKENVETSLSCNCGSELLLDLVEGFASRMAFEGKKPKRKEIKNLKTGIHQLIGLQV